MEKWFMIWFTVSISISVLIKSTLKRFFLGKKPLPRLPPGPSGVPIITNFLWLRKSLLELEHILRPLHAKLGPIVTLPYGFGCVMFVADRSTAQLALVQEGAIYSSRPESPLTNKLLSCNQHDISSCFYGPNWRLLRRNLSAEILHPSRVESYSFFRKRVLENLFKSLELESKSGSPVGLMKHFRYSMFSLLVLMCFGDNVEEDQIREIQDVQRCLMMSFNPFSIVNYWPRVTRVLFRHKWDELYRIRRRQEETYIPLIKARKQAKGNILAYVDTLHDLHLPEDNRKLIDGEMVSLCSEFLNGGTDTTATTTQWIMANLVKHQHIQDKLYHEIRGVVGDGAKMVEEHELKKMPYLKAVVYEGLRRHPPEHIILGHTVTEDTVLNGFLVPEKSIVNFMAAEMGWDSKVWENSMDFRPERFVGAGDGFDITGTKEIKMMPFGVGKRICPGRGLALHHLQFFVSNMVWRYKWTAVEGDEVDLSEKQEFTVVMKNPLKAHISLRL